jgi:ribosomal protein L31E
MSTFCPIIKEQCKAEECMAWRDDKCLIFSYLETLVALPYRESDEEDDELEFSEQRKVPEHIKSATPEELATELVAFAKREFAHEEMIWIPEVAEFFWEKKGIEKWDMPADIRLKLEKAESLAKQQIESEREAELKAQLEKEKAELTELVAQCVTWASEQGLSRLTNSDIDAFLLEIGREILPQTKKAIYATANVQLKSAKKK